MAKTKKANPEAVAEAVEVKTAEVNVKTNDVKSEAEVGAKAEKATPAKKTSTARKSAVKTEKSADEQPAKKKPAAKKTKTVTLTPFEEIVALASKKTAKAKSFKDFAAQITMNGKVEGIFYVKSADGNVDVQPFDYKNADVYVTVDSDALVTLIGGGDVEKAVKDGLLEMNGGSFSTAVALKSVLL